MHCETRILIERTAATALLVIITAKVGEAILVEIWNIRIIQKVK